MKYSNHWLRIVSRALLAAVVALTLGTASAHALVVPVLAGESAAEAVFAEPLPGDKDDSIHTHLLGLINSTPSGARIRAAIHSIDNSTIADALKTAQARGVDVKVVYPANKRGSLAADRLAALGTVQWCDHNVSGGTYGYGCISTHSGGTMHSKFFLFSAIVVGGVTRKWVTWFGSANQTRDTGAATWNDALTVYDNQTLFNSFEQKLFNPMYGDNLFLANNDFFRPEIAQGYFSVPTAGVRTYASPEQDSDLVVARLNEMSPIDGGCSVMVGMAIFTRTVVADKLAAMKRAGCSVFVLVGMDDPAPTLNNLGQCAGKAHLGDNTNVFNTLNSAGIPIRKKKIHDKMMLLNSTNGGTIVLTGSHNLTSSALRENDEILVRVHSGTVYGAFSDHWWSAWTEGSCNVTSYNP